MAAIVQERWYQNECADELFIDAIVDDCHPVGAVPTGGGKTIIMCKLIEKLVDHNPLANILILAADKRILEQNKAALESYFEGLPIGLCSSGLKSYDIRKITVAGIQSIWRKPEDFARFDYIIVDECHLVNTETKGMYRDFMSELDDATFIGVTATPFRTKHGYIYEGKDALFTKISYNMFTPEIYNQIVAEGYLSRLFSKPTAIRLSGDGCKTQAGDWKIKDLSKKNDREEITTGAIMETIHFGKNYKHWLFFAIDIQHCEHITETLIEHGISAVAIHSKAEDVDQKIEDFKSGVYRAAIQVDMLTTGFDFPGIDLIADMRPTKSLIVHVQGKGRGGRVIYEPGYDLDTIEGRLAAIDAGPKPHCLVLDFAGNVGRLGPINRVIVRSSGEKGDGSGEGVTKECPECGFINWGGAKECENCYHEFEFKQELSMTASSDSIIAETEKKSEIVVLSSWRKVDKTTYKRHVSKNTNPDSLLVTYHCGLFKFSEHVNIDHKGMPRHFAKNWIHWRWGWDKIPVPDNLTDLLKSSNLLTSPGAIEVDISGKYDRITDHSLPKT